MSIEPGSVTMTTEVGTKRCNNIVSYVFIYLDT